MVRPPLKVVSAHSVRRTAAFDSSTAADSMLPRRQLRPSSRCSSSGRFRRGPDLQM